MYYITKPALNKNCFQVQFCGMFCPTNVCPILCVQFRVLSLSWYNRKVKKKCLFVEKIIINQNQFNMCLKHVNNIIHVWWRLQLHHISFNTWKGVRCSSSLTVVPKFFMHCHHIKWSPRIYNFIFRAKGYPPPFLEKKIKILQSMWNNEIKILQSMCNNEMFEAELYLNFACFIVKLNWI